MSLYQHMSRLSITDPSICLDVRGLEQLGAALVQVCIFILINLKKAVALVVHVCAIEWSITKHRPCSIIHPILHYSRYTYHPYEHPSY